MNERAVNCYQKEQPRRLRHSTGNSSPAPVPVWHTWKMISLLCLSPALLNLQFLPLFMINETAESWISACTDNTKHCQTPPDWHWAFSCPAGMKNSALYVSNWLSALKKNPILVLLLDKIFPWVGEISYLLGYTTSCGHPFLFPLFFPHKWLGNNL